MREIAKIKQYTCLKDVNNAMIIKKAFDCPLLDCMYGYVEKQKRIGRSLEDDYYNHMEQ